MILVLFLFEDHLFEKKLLTSLNDIFTAVFIALLIGEVQLIKNNKRISCKHCKSCVCANKDSCSSGLNDSPGERAKDTARLALTTLLQHFRIVTVLLSLHQWLDDAFFNVR